MYVSAIIARTLDRMNQRMEVTGQLHIAFVIFKKDDIPGESR
ncbi:hypothetical protein ASZ90_017540 [hydrocarbon metagenome]|uniref:Uncharacterized protein n=1 Tax=hydrocarbon metagenome TaxID=938273 RepID=A0A0W8E8T9_9ZZZZ